MDKFVELIKLLEKLFGKGAVSRTIGTRTNVVRFPKGKQPVDPTTGEFRIEELKGENPDSYQVIKNSIEDRMGDITKMNDSELLNYTANVRRMVNAEFPPPLPEADVVKFGSGQEIKGKGLEELIEKQGTKNPPTTIAGELETQGKRLEKAGEDLKEITEQKPEFVIDDIMKDYMNTQKIMQSSQRTGYVRATVRQIMREDIQAGKLKLPKELQDQVMQGLGEPIDIYRKVYGEGALEQVDSLADDLGQFRTEEEAAKFTRSKYKIEPKAEPVDESKTYEELEDIFKKGSDEPENKADGGRIGFNKGKKVMSEIDKLIEQLNKKTKGKKSMESVNPKTGEVTLPKKPIRRAEEPTGTTVMDPEPEIVDERSIPKTGKKTTQRYDQDIVKAADNIYPNYDDPKIAADQIVDSYAQMKYGLEDQYGLSNKERMDLYTQAYDYVMDYNRKARSIYKKGDPITEENFGSSPFAPSQETLDNLKKAREATKGMSLEEEMNMVLNRYDKSMFIKNEQGLVDVNNPENVQKMALLLKRDYPDLYKRLETQMLDETPMAPTLQEFKKTSPKTYSEFSKKTSRMQELLDFRSGQETFETFDLETYNYLNSKEIGKLLNQLKNPYKILDEEKNLVRTGFTRENFEGTGLKNFEDINFRTDEKKLETYLEDLYNKKQVEEAQTELSDLKDMGREPNASGGIAGLL